MLNKFLLADDSAMQISFIFCTIQPNRPLSSKCYFPLSAILFLLFSGIRVFQDKLSGPCTETSSLTALSLNS